MKREQCTEEHVLTQLPHIRNLANNISRYDCHREQTFHLPSIIMGRLLTGSSPGIWEIKAGCNLARSALDNIPWNNREKEIAKLLEATRRMKSKTNIQLAVQDAYYDVLRRLAR